MKDDWLTPIICHQLFTFTVIWRLSFANYLRNCMYAAVISATDVFYSKKNWKAASLLITIMIHEQEKKKKKKWLHQKWFLVSSSKRRFHWFLGLKRSQRKLGPDGNRCQPVCCVKHWHALASAEHTRVSAKPTRPAGAEPNRGSTHIRRST